MVLIDKARLRHSDPPTMVTRCDLMKRGWRWNGCDCDVEGGVDEWPVDDKGAEWNDIGEADGIGESTAVDAKTIDGEDGGEVEDHGIGECVDSTVADADDVDEEADVMGECANVADVVCEADGMECDFVLFDFLVLLLLLVVVFPWESLSFFQKNSVPTCKKIIAHIAHSLVCIYLLLIKTIVD